MTTAFILDTLAAWYLPLKAFHLVAVISWMAGLLYLPRLFVYHCGALVGSPQSETFKVMERKLMKGIMLPAMLTTFLAGGMLLAVPGVLESGGGWLHVKFMAVLLLAGCHGAFSKWRKDFERDQNLKSEKFFRILNEVPAILMILIVFMVVMKPF